MSKKMENLAEFSDTLKLPCYFYLYMFSKASTSFHWKQFTKVDNGYEKYNNFRGGATLLFTPPALYNK